MKSFLLFTLLLATLSMQAQTATDDNIKVSLSSYNSTFQVIVLDVESLSGCDSLITKFRWPGHPDSTFKFHKDYKGQIMLPFSGGSVTVQFKTVSNCNLQSNGPWTSLYLTALALREDNRITRPRPVIPVGVVRIVAMNGSMWKEMSETEFLRQKQWYRRSYFILRANKAKEVIL